MWQTENAISLKTNDIHHFNLKENLTQVAVCHFSSTKVKSEVSQFCTTLISNWNFMAVFKQVSRTLCPSMIGGTSTFSYYVLNLCDVASGIRCIFV